MENGKPRLAISRPGQVFSAEWLCGWENLLLKLAPHFNLSIITGYLTEVCMSRVDHANEALAAEPDFYLMIDHDNPPSAIAAMQLLSDLAAQPEIGIACGWYKLESGQPSFGRSYNAIGSTAIRRRNADLEDFLNTEAPDLQEIDWTGLGFVMMRGSVLVDVGHHGFLPDREGGPDDWNGSLDLGFIWDDFAFCKRARAKGHRLFVDRRVKLEHLKLRAI